MNSPYETLNAFERDDIFYLEINRPDKLNALNATVLSEMLDVINSIDVSKYRGLILTGAGEKAFIAGADIESMSNMTPEASKDFAILGQSVTLAMEDLALPIIACVHGFALGGGCEMAMSCDFIFASKEAIFGQPEIRLGLIPAFGGTQRLPKYIGRNRAKELIYSGNHFNIEDAYQWGLVNRVLEDKSSCIQAAIDYLHALKKCGPLAIASAKKVINAGVDLSNRDGLVMEATVFSEISASLDRKEGTKAFVEKRKPVFKGH
jgi:enoyl-CoA hydratase